MPLCFIWEGEMLMRESSLKLLINTDPEHLAFVKARPLPSKDNNLEAGSVAKDFEMRDRDGNLVKLSDFKGKLVYMDIWATWCGPCVEEIPNMEKLYQHYKDDPRVLLVLQ